MTITTNPTTAASVVEHIDPNSVEFEDNVRTDIRLDPGFVASIRAEGVLLPVLARRGNDGTVYVRDGQRRTLAARKAGLATIPAYFGAGEQTKAARIAQQLITNDRRTDLAQGERVAAYEQLALEGLSVAKIAKATGADKTQVQDSLIVAKSDTARAALSQNVSLDRALLIAEFEGDAEAQDTVLRADEDDLAYVAQALRNEQAIAEATATAVARFQADGVTVHSQWQPGWGRLYQLTDAAEDADERPELTPEAHAGCEGRAIYLRVWGTGEDNLDAEEVCSRVDLHNTRWRTTATSTQPVAEEEQTAEQVEAEQEQKRAARRRLIAKNKAWDAAEQVRREWIATLIARKALPKNAQPFIALTFTRHIFDVTSDHGTHTAAFLGLDTTALRDRVAATVEQNPTRAAHVALAVALSAREHRTSRESWRTPNRSDQAYLRQGAFGAGRGRRRRGGPRPGRLAGIRRRLRCGFPGQGLVIRIIVSASGGARAAEEIRWGVEAGAVGVLGVATGSSPLPIYEELAKRPPTGAADLRVFALDEYVGLPADDPHSFSDFVRRRVSRPLGVADDNVAMPDGMARDTVLEAERYERAISEAGGTDLQLLGIGSNGHIGFNEPGSARESRTRVVDLAERTRQDNASAFGGSAEAVPSQAITQAIGTILAARALVLVASGERKAPAIAEALEGPVGEHCPASFLRGHPAVTVILDRAAASRLNPATLEGAIDA